MSKKGYVIDYSFLGAHSVRHSSFVETVNFSSAKDPYNSGPKKTNYYFTVVGSKGYKAALVFKTVEQAKALISALAPADQKACKIIDLYTGEVIE